MATQIPTLTAVNPLPKQKTGRNDTTVKTTMDQLPSMISDINSNFVPAVNTISTTIENSVTTCTNKAQEAADAAGLAIGYASTAVAQAQNASDDADDALAYALRSEAAKEIAEETSVQEFLTSSAIIPSSESEFTVNGLQKTVTLQCNSDGALSVTSSDDSIATASILGNTVTITGGFTLGTATITITSARTATYYSTTATVRVDNVSGIENFPWDLISDIGSKGNGANYWDIGDTKSVLINGTIGTLAVNGTFKVVIIDFNYRGNNGIYFQGFKDSNGVDIALCDSKYSSISYDGTKYFNMNHWGSTSSPYNKNIGGWIGCDLRYDVLGSTETQPYQYGSTINVSSRTGYDATVIAKTNPVPDTLMAALPQELRDVMSLWTIYTDNKGASSNVQANVTASVDYLPLLSEFEVQGSRSYANQYEKIYQSQMAYYANGNSKVRYTHDDDTTACRWWLRSPYYNDSGSFCYVATSGGGTYTYSYRSYGLAPAFRLAEPAS